jgi:S1-C subfamily serine protease
MTKAILNSVRTLLVAGIAPMFLAFAAFAQSVAPVATMTVQAQTPSQPATPEKTQPRRVIRRLPATPAKVTVISDQTRVAPQVVTIVHRLNGFKMLRFLLRQGGEPGTVYTIDPEAISDDAHASIIAGWALDDGKTIAARLPQADAEVESTLSPSTSGDLMGQLPGAATARSPMVAPRSEPDVTVITRDGRKLRARYVGLDAQTGLSVLQVNGAITPSPNVETARELIEGQRVQLFAPEQTTPEGEVVPGITYVRIGEIDAKVANLTSSSPGKVQRFTVSSAKLSPVLIGGIACDEAGNTLGIVDAIEGNDARIVSADTIRAATRRVLERQASVPRPLLGVRGEPVEFAARAAFLAHGWRDDQLTELIRKQVGILLTSVMAGTPAAFAKLQPGDVIVQVNKNDIKNAEEFSKLLGEAGSGQQVEFMVRRASSPSPLSIDVKLGGSFSLLLEPRFEMPAVTTPFLGLQGLGVETVALTAKVASQFGAENGLLVLAVQPESPAARAGMREGDVIESIDGRTLARRPLTLGFEFDRQKKHVLSLVRNREKKQVALEPEE